MKLRQLFRLLGITLVGAVLLLLATVGVVLGISLSADDCAPEYNYSAQSARLRQHVETLCNQPRYGDSKEHARKYIEEELRRAGWEVSRQYFTTSDGEQHCNLSAIRRGKSPQRYIIGAHYDACDTDEGNPGADDNASAVAVLLELARTLPPGTPEQTIELVAWDCEEPPYYDTEDMGSTHHATACTPAEVRGLICLEMLGYFSHEEGSQPPLFPGHSLLLPTVGNFVAIVGDWNALSLGRQAYTALRTQLPVVRINIPFSHSSDLYLSDHRNYAPRGIPAIMVTDTAMLRNPNYHEPSDTPETLNYNYMARVTHGVTQLVQTLAGT